MEYKRPQIHVSYSKECERYVKDILAGIEEEGLFSYSYEEEDGNPIKAAYHAAESSLLGVGITIMKYHVVLHVQDLKIDEPILIMGVRDSSMLRIFGSNAARYIKGVPFKLKQEYFCIPHR
jgi:hypothetical protein